MVDGYEPEQAEVGAVLNALVGHRDPGDSDEEWFAHLSGRLALLAAVVQEVSQARGELVAVMLRDDTDRNVAARLGLSPARPGQLAKKARARVGN